MKLICIIFSIVVISFNDILYAQENSHPKDSVKLLNECSSCPKINSENDSLETSLVSPIIPYSTSPTFSMYGITPFYHNYASWDLHKGFNASIGMNITFSPSKYMPNGAGFGQDAAFMYAVPINNRFSIAAGLYASNFNWGWIDYKNVGIAATAAFKVNERITLYGYGNKSLMPQRSLIYYPIPNFAPDKIGGMINFKIGESSSISFGVEGIKGGYPYY